MQQASNVASKTITALTVMDCEPCLATEGVNCVEIMNYPALTSLRRLLLPGCWTSTRGTVDPFETGAADGCEVIIRKRWRLIAVDHLPTFEAP